MELKKIESLVILLLILSAFFIGIGAGYIKGGADAVTALNPSIKLCSETLIDYTNKYLDCEKELWINEKNELGSLKND